jgi:hypothetical protein
VKAVGTDKNQDSTPQRKVHTIQTSRPSTDGMTGGSTAPWKPVLAPKPRSILNQHQADS